MSKKLIRTNCSECGYLHIFSKKIFELYNWKYTCRKCGTINDIPELRGKK